MNGDLLSSVLQLGLGGVAVLILGITLQKVSKTLSDTNKKFLSAYERLIAADQDSREKMTTAIISMYKTLDSHTEIHARSELVVKQQLDGCQDLQDRFERTLRELDGKGSRI